MAKHNKHLILIIDDNPNNVQFLSGLLADNGFLPAAALDGENAITFINEKLPDLILLDIMMSGLDGFEVCKKIKQDDRTKHIPIIFLTAKTETDDIVHGFDLGAVDYITKPFNSRELLARVKTHLELKILRGLIPICSNCKKIRNDDDYWQSIETYFHTHSEIEFSHGLCPNCEKALYGNESWYIKLQKKQKE